MRVKYLAGAAVVALGSLWLTPALAAAPVVASGDIGVGYSYSTVSDGGGNSNNVTVNGAATLPVAANWAVQATAGYNHLSGSYGFSEDNGYGLGAAFFANSMGRLGVTGGYSQTNLPGGLSADLGSYGVFADWYASQTLTVSARGGGISGSLKDAGASLNVTSGYVGGQVIGYFNPNLALSGTVDYVSIPVSSDSLNSTNVQVGAEYLWSQRLPLSVSIAYRYTNEQANGLGGSLNESAVLFGLKYYFGGHGTLEDHQRTGSENWGASAPVTSLILN